MTVLITGSTGKLGSELSKLFPASLTPAKTELDLASVESILSFIKGAKPDLVMHLAALTTINACQNNKELAWKTNAEGTLALVKTCEKYSPHARFVYMSTPCVFYGDKGSYVESDVPNPKNYYAFTKLAGEMAVKASSLSWLIVRGNFVPKAPWPYPKAFIDRFGTYLFANQLAGGIKDVIDEGLVGTIHLVGDRKLSMLDLARITTPNVLPMTLKEYEGPPLTVDMSLASERWKSYTLA